MTTESTSAASQANSSAAATAANSGATAGGTNVVVPAAEAKVPDPLDQGWLWLPVAISTSSLAAVAGQDTSTSIVPKRSKGRTSSAKAAAAAVSAAANDQSAAQHQVRHRVFSLVLEKIRAYRYTAEGSGNLVKDLSQVLEFCPDRASDPVYYEKVGKKTDRSCQRLRLGLIRDGLNMDFDKLLLIVTDREARIVVVDHRQSYPTRVPSRRRF